MENRLVILAVFVTVVQGAFASSAGEGINASSDIQAAHEKTTELWIRAMDVLFESIADNSSSDHAKNEYATLLERGYKHIFAFVPSSSRDDTLEHDFSNGIKTFAGNLFNTIDLAKSKNGTYLDILTGINAVHTNLNFQPSVRSVFELIRIPSVVLWTKMIADGDTLYTNIFAAMISRTALDFGFVNSIPSSFKDAAIAATKSISQGYYSFIQNKPTHFCVSDVISSIIADTSSRAPLKYFPRSFQEYMYSYCWPH